MAAITDAVNEHKCKRVIFSFFVIYYLDYFLLSKSVLNQKIKIYISQSGRVILYQYQH